MISCDPETSNRKPVNDIMAHLEVPVGPNTCQTKTEIYMQLYGTLSKVCGQEMSLTGLLPQKGQRSSCSEAVGMGRTGCSGVLSKSAIAGLCCLRLETANAQLILPNLVPETCK